MNSNLYSHNHIKGCWEWHLEWCPKYRFNMLGKESIQGDCEEIIFRVCEENNWIVLELAVLPDHVHIVLRSMKPENPSNVLFQLKSRSERDYVRRQTDIHQTNLKKWVS
ncbi:MAG: IS200/IS605 family transposase [archaeon]